MYLRKLSYKASTLARSPCQEGGVKSGGICKQIPRRLGLISAFCFGLGAMQMPCAADPFTILQSFTSKDNAVDVRKIEASGVVWHEQHQQYLLVSDEIYNEDPGLFSLSTDAQSLQRLKLPEAIKIDDLESISLDGGNVYALSSQAVNKHGELKAKRRKLLRFVYQQGQVSKVQSIDLLEHLTAIQRANPHTPLGEFLERGLREQSLDIEAHFIKDQQLYLGFKSPSTADGSTVIVKLADVNRLFSGSSTTAEIWQTLRLALPDSKQLTQLSEMLRVNDSLYLLSVGDTDSYLWRYNATPQSLQLLKTFSAAKAEGIAYRADLEQFLVVFDAGKEHVSKYQFLPLAHLGP